MHLQDFKPPIYCSASDFASISQNGALCDANGDLGPAEFETIMRQQVRLYTQRQVVETLMHGQASAADFVQLEALKFVAMDLGKMQSAVHGTESAMRSLQDELTRLRLGGGAGEPQAGVLEEIREILAHLRSLADGAAGGGSDKFLANFQLRHDKRRRDLRAQVGLRLARDGVL